MQLNSHIFAVHQTLTDKRLAIVAMPVKSPVFPHAHARVYLALIGQVSARRAFRRHLKHEVRRLAPFVYSVATTFCLQSAARGTSKTTYPSGTMTEPGTAGVVYDIGSARIPALFRPARIAPQSMDITCRIKLACCIGVFGRLRRVVDKFVPGYFVRVRRLRLPRHRLARHSSARSTSSRCSELSCACLWLGW